MQRGRAGLFAGTLLLLIRPAHSASLPAVEAEHGMVVSSQRLASEAGIEMLRAGGNAVDAAVAVGYALAVVDPCCGNIGGGGFMTLRLADGRETVLDFRETAPASATAGMYLDDKGDIVPGSSLYGWKAVTVPGTVRGLDAALSRYGHLPRATVMAPAIRLAREGFRLTRGDTDILQSKTGLFRKNAEAASIFLHPDGEPWQPGDVLVQTRLADTLQAIAQTGPDAFYLGNIPEAVEAASRAGGGVIAHADFAAYKVAERVPVRCTYRGAVVVSAPPPSSGGITLCEILNILSGYDLHDMGFHSAAAVHLMVEAMRHAFVDRNFSLGDPAFVNNPIEYLLSPAHADAIRAAIAPGATPSRHVAMGIPPHERPETTSYAVVDEAGNAVAVTYTLNGWFGAGVMAPGTGFLLNDEMDDFTAKPGTPNLYGLMQGDANAIAPGKRPLSSMAPTIVTRDGHVSLVLGSPGGSRIITIVLEAILNVLDHRMAPQEAVDAPRLHHQWMPDTLLTEPFALSPDTEALLRNMGYSITTQTPWGAAELIEVGPPRPDPSMPSSGNDAAVSGRVRPGLLYGVSDPRRPAGAAIGF
jgi:gamma-glutamyltranspeptidase/glutathione hydrolase